MDYPSGQLWWQGQTEWFNAEGYVEFLQKVLDQTSGLVIISQDGSPYHTAKLTRAFVEQNKERLTVYNYRLTRLTSIRLKESGDW